MLFWLIIFMLKPRKNLENPWEKKLWVKLKSCLNIFQNTPVYNCTYLLNLEKVFFILKSLIDKWCVMNPVWWFSENSQSYIYLIFAIFATLQVSQPFHPNNSINSGKIFVYTTLQSLMDVKLSVQRFWAYLPWEWAQPNYATIPTIFEFQVCIPVHTMA